ncbi:MAG: prolipoprotein diacylglyceryl transferase [Actinobacteria bacterium]|nr:prolipoprotein diacylglyceryl transferase [Actinomycetota bacterium]
MFLASIPSPASGEIELGPLTLHAYGLMLLLGILGAIGLAGMLWTRRGGEWDLVLRVAMWGVAGGIVGARLYHVATSWSEIDDPKLRGIIEIWEGGLGIWGGIAGGVLVGSIVIRRAGESVFAFMDVAAPGLLLAQAIGRWGNYFNQELFGVPTNRPWGLEIDPENRPDQYTASDTFHPLFLYESLWNLLGVVVLLLVRARFRIRAPGLFCLYVAWYTFGRFFLELIRTDEAHELFGLRVNNYVSLVLFVLAVAGFVWSQRREEPPPERRRAIPEPARKMAVPKGRVRPRR